MSRGESGAPRVLAQDTGNPVLDSLANIVAAWGPVTNERIAELHRALMAAAEKEPGGLCARGEGGELRPVNDDEEE